MIRWLKLWPRRFAWLAFEFEAVFLGSGARNPYGMPDRRKKPVSLRRDDGWPR